MVTLAQFGLPITLQLDVNRLALPSNLFSKYEEKIYRLRDVGDSFLNADLENPEYIYSEYRDVYRNEDVPVFSKYSLRHNIIYLPSQMIGVEYSRTHIYTSKFLTNKKIKKTDNLLDKFIKVGISSVIEPIYGQCLVMMQVRKSKEDWLVPANPEVEFSALVKLRKGEKFTVPCGYDFTIINIRSTPCIVSKVYKNDYKLNYKSLPDARGMSHYIIRKNGRTEAVPNCHYKNNEVLNEIKQKELAEEFKFDNKGLYLSVCNNPKEFDKIISS